MNTKSSGGPVGGSFTLNFLIEQSVKTFCSSHKQSRLVMYRAKALDRLHNVSFRYEGESISNLPNLFPVESYLFFFNVIALLFDASRPTVFKYHLPRTE